MNSSTLQALPVEEADIPIHVHYHPNIVTTTNRIQNPKASPIEEADIPIEVSPTRFSPQPIVEGCHRGGLNIFLDAIALIYS